MNYPIRELSALFSELFCSELILTDLICTDLTLACANRLDSFRDFSRSGRKRTRRAREIDKKRAPGSSSKRSPISGVGAPVINTKPTPPRAGGPMQPALHGSMQQPCGKCNALRRPPRASHRVARS